MIDEILPDLFKIKIPLPRNPLKYLNSYVVRGTDKNLVIDTGFNRKECLEAMKAGLSQLELDLRETDFLITHRHADHYGLVSKLVTDSSKVYFNGEDKGGWEARIQNARRNGFPEDQLRAAFHGHPGYKYGSETLPELTPLKDGHTIIVGDYFFKCIETPGHAEGHICLYDPDKRVFVSGDHILIDITPNIQCWSKDDNPLEDYLTSLDKVYDLEVDLVLPGHRRLFRNHRERIEELKRHHQERADEVLSILGRGPKNAFEVAGEMTWDIDCESWDQFPVAQKWFATGEAIAHLRYVEGKGLVFRETGEQIITFLLSPEEESYY
jgi:glyoxylase-like metal-dependent hydrolase (beta-lactamase superfamily II)